MMDPTFDPLAILEGHEIRLNNLDRQIRQQNELITNLAKQNGDLLDLIIANQQQIKQLKKTIEGLE